MRSGQLQIQCPHRIPLMTNLCHQKVTEVMRVVGVSIIGGCGTFLSYQAHHLLAQRTSWHSHLGFSSQALSSSQLHQQLDMVSGTSRNQSFFHCYGRCGTWTSCIYRIRGIREIWADGHNDSTFGHLMAFEKLSGCIRERQ